MKLLCTEPMPDKQGSSAHRRRRMPSFGGPTMAYSTSSTSSDTLSTTSDSESAETGAALVPMRLIRKDGGYMHLVLPMHPVRDRSNKKEKGELAQPAGRSLIGARAAP